MKTYEKLYLLLASTPDYVSGQEVADQLQLSRTSIWKAAQKLETLGLTIESSPKKGYRLLTGDLLIPETIKENSPLAQVLFDPKGESTQVVAKTAAQNGCQGDTLFLANQQTKAYGRFGRTYFAPDKGGIYMTLLLKSDLTVQEVPRYTLKMVAAIHKAIEELTGLVTSIKWVNDLYYKGKKIAGILTEASASVETGLITDLYIGMAINFNIMEFPEDLKEKAGSLFQEERPAITRNQLIAAIWRHFYTADWSELLERYKKHSLVVGHTIRFQQNKKDYQGLATGISDHGQLLVQLEDGTQMSLASGEISLSGWD